MNESVKKFIEKHADLIKNEDFESLYSKSFKELYSDTGKLTEALLNAGINPLDYLTEIPAYYLHQISSVSKVVVPDYIASIGLSAFSACYNLTSIVIPNSVTSIKSYAFDDCSNLTSITIPNSITLIDYKTFSDCSSLTSISIPNSVTSISSGAFSNCRSLISITIPDSVTSIGISAFSNCQSLTKILIPENVTQIKYLPFQGCDNLTELIWNAKNCEIEPFGAKGGNWLNLTSAIIGQSVQVIPTNLFKNCSKLTTIRFVGTKNQWKSLLKKSSWRKGSSIKTIHCTDGDINL